MVEKKNLWNSFKPVFFALKKKGAGGQNFNYVLPQNWIEYNMIVVENLVLAIYTRYFTKLRNYIFQSIE